MGGLLQLPSWSLASSFLLEHDQQGRGQGHRLPARLSGVGRRLIQKWLQEKRPTAYSIAGDRRRFVDVDEIKKLREPRPISGN